MIQPGVHAGVASRKAAQLLLLPLPLLLLPQIARAGSLSGAATIPEKTVMPPDAVFEAVLIDAALADAPARELGRVRLQPAGQPPFRFTIPYRDSDVRPGGRYAVRATVRQADRLLFTTDTVTPALTGGAAQPLNLRMVQVGGSPAPSRGPLGALPASWRGDLSGAGGLVRWQVDLATDGSFQLRQSALHPPVAHPSEGHRQATSPMDDIGRWRLEPGSNRLVLQGGREASVLLMPLDGGTRLRRLDLDGRPVPSPQNDLLQRLAAYEPIDPRLHLLGMVRYQADATRIRLCSTGADLPVAMEGDHRRLERAYLRTRANGAAGQPLLANLEGLITLRPSAEPFGGRQRTLVVERFIGVHPGKGCPPLDPLPTPRNSAMGAPPLRGTLWRLEALQDGQGSAPIDPLARAVELQLDAGSPRLSGSGGCNRLIGGFRLDGERLRFSRIAATMMACPAGVMTFERRYVQALERVRRWRLQQSRLELQDARGQTVLRFAAVSQP